MTPPSLSEQTPKTPEQFADALVVTTRGVPYVSRENAIDLFAKAIEQGRQAGLAEGWDEGYVQGEKDAVKRVGIVNVMNNIEARNGPNPEDWKRHDELVDRLNSPEFTTSNPYRITPPLPAKE